MANFFNHFFTLRWKAEAEGRADKCPIFELNLTVYFLFWPPRIRGMAATNGDAAEAKTTEEMVPIKRDTIHKENYGISDIESYSPPSEPKR